MKKLLVQARAKINLGLEITGKRTDGYHDLETIFQEIELADRLELSLGGSEIFLEVDDRSLPADESNLAWRAAELFLRETPFYSGARIKLWKKIPRGAGLGGGSSDAAGVLKGLNRLAGGLLSTETLMKLAAGLGSDVPFFIKGGTAYATGRGEILEFLPVRGWRQDVIIVKPEASLSTEIMYRSLKIELTSRLENIRMLRRELLANSFLDLGRYLFNRFEKTADSLCPETGIIKQRLLESGCGAALLCGSGSAVFGLAGSLEDARRISDNWKRRGETVFVTKICS